MITKRLLSILLENESGALSRVIGLFSQRSYNIESLTVAPTEDVSISNMTVLTIGSERVLEQIQKQLKKLIDVLQVTEITDSTHVLTEVLLVKINSSQCDDKIIKIINDFNGKIISSNKLNHIIQLSNSSDLIDNFLKLITKIIKITQITRSGIISIIK